MKSVKHMKQNDIKILVNGQPIADIVGVEFTMSAEDIVAKLIVQTSTSTFTFKGNMQAVETIYT